MGIALIDLSAGSISAGSNEMLNSQALYVGQGGLEDARRNLDFGQSPNVTNKALGFGSYTTTSVPDTGLITVASQIGNAKKTQHIYAKFSKDCISFDTSEAQSDDDSGYNLINLRMIKTCNQEAELTEMTVSWNWHECVLNANDPFTECPNEYDDGEARVQLINVEDEMVYNPGLGIGTPGGGGAASGEPIDLEDYTLMDNGLYAFEGHPHSFRFSKKHPQNAVYTVTLTFADGSSITSVFRDDAPQAPGNSGGKGVGNGKGIKTR